MKYILRIYGERDFWNNPHLPEFTQREFDSAEEREWFKNGYANGAYDFASPDELVFKDENGEEL
jgi:hypothetical protein